MHFKSSACLALASAILLCLALSSHVQAQTTLYGQSAYPSSDYHWNFGFSGSNPITLNGTSYGPFLTYDDFTLSSTAQIGTVDWQGLTIADPTFGRGHQGIEPATFTINFLSDAAGLPGTIINSQTVSATKTFVNSGDFYDDGASINIYSYSASLLPTPVMQGNTKYWISIVGNTAGESGWAWTSGEPGDGSTYQIDRSDSSENGFFQYDRAFSLGAPSPVPEASSVVSLGLLLLLGLGGVAVSRRRRASTSR